MMTTRRHVLKALAVATGGIGTLMVPGWFKHVSSRDVGEAPPERTAPTIQIPPPAPVAPEPLGSDIVGADGRRLSFDSDRGRATLDADGAIFLQSGIGPRLLRLDATALADFEGESGPYRQGIIAGGDLLHVAGRTLSDYSIQVSRVSINPLGNLIGIFALADAGRMAVFPRTGKESNTYLQEPWDVLYDGRTRLYGGRGNFQNPNRNIGDLRRGSWVMCNGYRDRDGTIHVTDCYFGNELPPTDAPQSILDKVAAAR